MLSRVRSLFHPFLEAEMVSSLPFSILLLAGIASVCAGKFDMFQMSHVNKQSG